MIRPILILLITLITSVATGKSSQHSHQAHSCHCHRHHPSPFIHLSLGKHDLQKLLQQEDRDHDQKITIDDLKIKGGVNQFLLIGKMKDQCLIKGSYYLSNLLQELTLALTSSQSEVILSLDKIFEPPVQRISRQIREVYWDGLTRRIDKEHLLHALEDEKLQEQKKFYLFVPSGDERAIQYFTSPSINLEKLPTPRQLTDNLVQTLTSEKKHGLLSLQLQQEGNSLRGVPFVVPGGRFNEMYGWDSYFESVGLALDQKEDLIKAMVDNFVYQIQHYGKILNANRTYYLNRSQPPFLTSMVELLSPHLPTTPSTHKWKANVLKAAIQEYQDVWMNSDHLTPIGLSRYFGSGRGIPPEVEPGHFDKILLPFAKKSHLSLAEFKIKFNQGQQGQLENGQRKWPQLDEFFQHDLCVRESGHDTTYRWFVNGEEKCADFVTVDLNSLLYKMEIDIASMIKKDFSDHFLGSTSSDWFEKAKKRRQLLLKYLWDPKQQLFYDYNYKTQKKSLVLSATTFYPLWAWSPLYPETKILSGDQVKNLVHRGLLRLEQPGGISATENQGQAQDRQWGYPYGWAPHQMILWQGLVKYNMQVPLQRLIDKWITMITVNAIHYNGTIPEKFNVVNQSHHVFAEYGNVGTKFSYMTKEGFGWMNASYQLGLHLQPSLYSSNWKKFDFGR